MAIQITPKQSVEQVEANEAAIALNTAKTIDDTAYDETSWNANSDAATKNAIRDKNVTQDAATDLKADPINITGTHNETVPSIDFSMIQGKKITLTADRPFTISGLTSSNFSGFVDIPHNGFTPSFSGVTELDSPLDKSGVYYLRFLRMADGTIIQTNQSGGGASTLVELDTTVTGAELTSMKSNFDIIHPEVQIGEITSLSTASSTDVRKGCQFTFPSDGDYWIKSITLYQNGGTASNFLAGVYDNNVGDYPDNRLGTSVSTAVDASPGWQTVPLVTPFKVTAGQVIWLCWVGDSFLGFRYTAVQGDLRFTGSATYSLPDPMADGSNTGDATYAIYCNAIRD